MVDRKKELIISAAGKNMSPANIENAIKAGSGLIGNVVCVGDRRPFNVALIALDGESAVAGPRAAASPSSPLKRSQVTSRSAIRSRSPCKEATDGCRASSRSRSTRSSELLATRR